MRSVTSCGRWHGGWPGADTGSSCSRRRARPSWCASRGGSSGPASSSRPTARCRCSASASCCRSRPRGAVPPLRRRSTSRARSRMCSDARRSTSSTSTSRSRRAPPRSRCASRGRSTWGRSTRPPSASSRPRSRAASSSGSSAGSTRAPPRSTRPACGWSARSPPTTGWCGPGADPPPPGAPVRGDGPLHIAFVDHEDRQALRLFLRALRRLPAGLDWRATVLTGPGARTPALRSRLADRVTVVAGAGGRRARRRRRRRGRVRRPGAGAGAARPRAGRGRDPARERAARLHGGASRTAGCSSRPPTSTSSPRSSSG